MGINIESISLTRNNKGTYTYILKGNNDKTPIVLTAKNVTFDFDMKLGYEKAYNQYIGCQNNCIVYLHPYQEDGDEILFTLIERKNNKGDSRTKANGKNKNRGHSRGTKKR